MLAELGPSPSRHVVLIPPAGTSADLSFRLGGLAARVRGVPENWVALLPTRLVGRPESRQPGARRTVLVQLARQERLRAPAGPHDLNVTSKLLFAAESVTYRSDWCEARIPRSGAGQIVLLCHPECGPWFGGILENVLRVLLAFAALERGAVMLHSAALVAGNRAAVLFGHSGAGKSTSGALALERGLSVISDDLNLLERAPAGWQVRPVPFSGTLNRCSDIRGPVPLDGLYPLFRARDDCLEECSVASAVSLLTASAPFVNQDPFVADRLFDVLIDLAGALPVRRLHFTRSHRFLDLLFGAAP